MISMRRIRSLLGLLVLVSIAGVTPTMAQPGAERPSWGGSDRILYAIGGIEFFPASSSVPFDSFDLGRHSTVPNGFFNATPHIPSGVLLTYFELDYCDSNAVGDVTLQLAECSFLGNDCVSIEILDSGSGPSGCDFVSVDLTPHNYTTNNNSRLRHFKQWCSFLGESCTLLGPDWGGSDRILSDDGPGGCAQQLLSGSAVDAGADGRLPERGAGPPLPELGAEDKDEFIRAFRKRHSSQATKPSE